MSARGKHRCIDQGSATHLYPSSLRGFKSVRGLQEVFVGLRNDSVRKSWNITTPRVCLAKYIGWWARFVGSRRLGSNRLTWIWFGTLPGLIIAAIYGRRRCIPLAGCIGAIHGLSARRWLIRPQLKAWSSAAFRGGHTWRLTSSRRQHGRPGSHGKGEGTTVEKHAPTDDEHSGLVSVELDLRVGANVESQDSKCATPIAHV